jgi:hypothetical protein
MWWDRFGPVFASTSDGRRELDGPHWHHPLGHILTSLYVYAAHLVFFRKTPRQIFQNETIIIYPYAKIKTCIHIVNLRPDVLYRNSSHLSLRLPVGFFRSWGFGCRLCGTWRWLLDRTDSFLHFPLLQILEQQSALPSGQSALNPTQLRVGRAVGYG